MDGTSTATSSITADAGSSTLTSITYSFSSLKVATHSLLSLSSNLPDGNMPTFIIQI